MSGKRIPISSVAMFKKLMYSGFDEDTCAHVMAGKYPLRTHEGDFYVYPARLLAGSAVAAPDAPNGVGPQMAKALDIIKTINQHRALHAQKRDRT